MILQFLLYDLTVLKRPCSPRKLKMVTLTGQASYRSEMSDLCACTCTDWQMHVALEMPPDDLNSFQSF